MNGSLPQFLKFKSAVDLVRVGRNNDGGYLISQSDIDASDMLIGLGVSDDWSFESDFCAYHNVPVIVYDASVSKKHFLKKIIKSLLRFDNPKIVIHWVKTYFLYVYFFRKKNKHIEKFVGLSADNKYCSMESVFKETDSSKIFLKIDIEGFEYHILNDLIKNEDRITGLVIEFHDCNLHVERIQKFVESLKMPLVHIHANNYASINENDALPLVFELTFSKHAELGSESILPHPLDMPNNKFADEISLSFAS